MNKDVDKIRIERTGEEEHKKTEPKYLEPVPEWFLDKYINGKENVGEVDNDRYYILGIDYGTSNET